MRRRHLVQNNQAFDRAANASGLYARSLNADAFADETKEQVAQIVRDDLGGLDVTESQSGFACQERSRRHRL